MRYIEAHCYVSGGFKVRIPYDAQRHEGWIWDGAAEYALVEEDIHDAAWKAILEDMQLPIELEFSDFKETME